MSRCSRRPHCPPPPQLHRTQNRMRGRQPEPAVLVLGQQGDRIVPERKHRFNRIRSEVAGPFKDRRARIISTVRKSEVTPGLAPFGWGTDVDRGGFCGLGLLALLGGSQGRAYRGDPAARQRAATRADRRTDNMNHALKCATWLGKSELAAAIQIDFFD